MMLTASLQAATEFSGGPMVAGTAEGSLLHLTKSKAHAIYHISCINIARAGDAEVIPGYHSLLGSSLG